ncbi:MAG TPA: tetratricopeptide repeat protein, partial [Tepidisphaeraceae bacterium]
MVRTWLTLIGLLMPAFCWADVLILKDGARLEGDVKRTDQGWTVTLPDGKTRTVSADAVKSIALGAAGADKSTVQEAGALASLRRSVDALSDINQIIERYQRLIDNTKDPATKIQAQADQQTWIERRDQGLVKHGGKWVAPEEVAVMAQKATETTYEARELIRQNRNKDADQVLQQALAGDPQNPACHYLRGIALFRMGKTVDARKAFEVVNSVVPNHAPTLNNLAVILWKQNAPAALNYYDRAMQAAGVNKHILDNVAEALGSMPQEQRKGPSVARCAQRFADLDVILQRQLEPEGLFRWGGGWVTQQQLDQLKIAEREVRDKLAAMQQEFDQAQARITEIDDQVRYDEAIMRDIFERNWVSAGNMIYMNPLPPHYYDLKASNQRLRSEQDELREKLKTMQDQAKRVQQSMPVPKFTGVQQ